jgi:hypothetical protein
MVTADELGAQIERDGPNGVIWVAMRENYPTDYRAFLDRAAQAINVGDQEGADRTTQAFMVSFLRTKVDRLTSAPSAQLHMIAQEYSALMHAFRTASIGLCAQYLGTRVSPADRPGDEVLRHLGRLYALQIAATHAGETSGSPPRTNLTEQDRSAWFAAMRAIDPAVPPLVEDPSRFDEASVEGQCNAGVTMYDAAAGLPLEPSANVTAHLLRILNGPGPAG